MALHTCRDARCVKSCTSLKPVSAAERLDQVCFVSTPRAECPDVLCSVELSAQAHFTLRFFCPQNYIAGWSMLSPTVCEKYGLNHPGHCASDASCDTSVTICADKNVVPRVAHAACADEACVRRAACQLGNAVANTTISAICLVNEGTDACPLLKCSARVAGWNGLVCEQYAQDRPGFCDEAGACGTDIAACSVVEAREPLFACRSAECRRACSSGIDATLLQFSDVCYSSNEPGSSAKFQPIRSRFVCRLPKRIEVWHWWRMFVPIGRRSKRKWRGLRSTHRMRVKPLFSKQNLLQCCV